MKVIMNILYYKYVFHMHREMFKSNHEKTNKVFEKTVRYNQQINNHKLSLQPSTIFSQIVLTFCH